VGTMSSYSRSASPSSVHPHGRGDNRSCASRCSRSAGSPPRAWGQCVCGDGARVASRFTPTGVGTIPTPPLPRPPPPVHPHGRGDNDGLLNCIAEHLGSPPRAWGQLGRAG